MTTANNPLKAEDRGIRRMGDFIASTPGAPIYQTEFGYYCLDRWYEEGLPRDADLAEFFGYDTGGSHALGGLGWCEAAFLPAFDEKVLEDRGDYELVQDSAGRGVLVFKGRRNGFMPEYVTHPVTDRASWEQNCKWRLWAGSPERYRSLEDDMAKARQAQARGALMEQHVVGGYMYLRSLMGPVDLLYQFVDNPSLIHDCMRTWLELADAVTARHQQYVGIDILYIGEDICYNHGTLISPDMIRTFLFPYYQQLLDNIRHRQPGRHLYFKVDTDGNVINALPLYKEIGMQIITPFEVAAGCDVVELGRRYPEIRMLGGIDKRILARGIQAIDREVDRIMPVMTRRGGYIPTCDHGVPMEVSLENYMHYRKRMLEY